MHQHYNHGLVLISLVVAILASYTALTLSLRIRLATGFASLTWLVGGGFAMGVGIWAMHFVGMLALSLPIPIVYDLSITLLSLLIAVVVSAFALRIASREHVTRGQLFRAGIAMGVGICSMHYVGMFAIEITPAIRYDPFWVAASLAIAIAASFAALWVAFTTREGARWWKYRIVFGAVGMGGAIAGMHYAGMAAAQFPPNAISTATALIDKAWLAGAVTTVTLFILFSALLLSLLEAQAAARAASMQASLAQANKNSRAKDEFLAMLGHELRNPLSAISNAIYLLNSSEPHTQPWQLSKEIIARQTAHLGAMVDDLLDVGRAVTGKISLNLHVLDLHDVVQIALRSLQATGVFNKHRLDYHGTSTWVRADQTRIEQIVTNLITNAVKYTPEGGRIEVQVRSDGETAVLTVTDNGIGMDEQTAAQVFDLFFQSNQDMNRSKGGLGIGLTLVKRIAELHSGNVSVTSPGPGKGTTVEVRLPVATEQHKAHVAATTATNMSQRRVLIVEDAPDVRNSLQRILEMAGHTVMTAEDGPGGLQQLTGANPDIALIDIGLPRMDGYEIVRRARSHGLRTRLVALTGYGLFEDKDAAKEAGFDAHLTKPVSIDSLLTIIAKTERVEN